VQGPSLGSVFTEMKRGTDCS